MDGLPGLFPILRQKGLFQLRQATLGSAHQVADRGIGLSHGLDRLLGGNAAIHHPGPVGLAVQLFDPFQEAGQGGFVAGIAWHDLIG